MDNASHAHHCAATLTLQRPAPVSKAASDWTSVDATGSLPCVTDNQTDDVIVGTLQFDNATPSYTPNFYVNLQHHDRQQLRPRRGNGSGNGNQCITDGSEHGRLSPAIQPNWVSSGLGTVPIDIFIHHDIGPAYPSGNPNNLGTLELVVNSQSAESVVVIRQSGIVTELNGPVMQVHLEPLH